MENPETSAQTLRYNMQSEDDLGWGRGAGCNGVIHILIEKIEASLHKQVQQANTYLESGYTISILKEIIPIETHQPPKYSEHDIKNVVVYTKVIPNKNKMNHTPCLKD